jgi:hypothetical protein
MKFVFRIYIMDTSNLLSDITMSQAKAMSNAEAKEKIALHNKASEIGEAWTREISGYADPDSNGRIEKTANQLYAYVKANPEKFPGRNPDMINFYEVLGLRSPVYTLLLRKANTPVSDVSSAAGRGKRKSKINKRRKTTKRRKTLKKF